MKIYSLFASVDGEQNLYSQGCFTTFIRLAGCNFNGDPDNSVRCKYCDTGYAQAEDSGAVWSVESIVQEVLSMGCPKVTITGGEPMAQVEELGILIEALKQYGIVITLETNGSYDVFELCSADGEMPVDCIVMDWKLSNSGEPTEYMDISNFLPLRSYDYVKFVVDDPITYREALSVKTLLQNMGCQAIFAFSPCFGKVEASELFEWLKGDLQLGLDVRLNVQLHKLIWPTVAIGEER
jgi:7-carboxy-7-deazaguanine synthase